MIIQSEKVISSIKDSIQDFSIYQLRKVLNWWKKLLDLVYQDVEKILQLLEVTSVTAEYVKLANIIDL